MSKQLLPTSGGKTRAQFREAYGISERAWKRLKATGNLPRFTWVTPNKAIIRPRHEEEWLDARTDPAPEAVSIRRKLTGDRKRRPFERSERRRRPTERSGELS